VPEVVVALQVRQAAKEVILKISKDYPMEIEKQISVTVFKKGILTIEAPTMILAELQMRSEGLKSDINKMLGAKVIKALRLKSS
jgi:hypothetical protein